MRWAVQVSPDKLMLSLLSQMLWVFSKPKEKPHTLFVRILCITYHGVRSHKPQKQQRINILLVPGERSIQEIKHLL